MAYLEALFLWGSWVIDNALKYLCKNQEPDPSDIADLK
jgi:hypothetical protein